MRFLGVLLDEFQIFADIDRQERKPVADADLDLILRARRRSAANTTSAATKNGSGLSSRCNRLRRERDMPYAPRLYSSAIGLRNVPTPWISTSTVSPFFIQTGLGLRAWPTPDGVPVKMTSPGSSVMPWVM